MSSADLRIRLAAFDWLRNQQDRAGDDVLSRSLLATGFVLDGTRVALLGPQGIFKPRLCVLPLSITTSPRSSYQDGWEGGLIRYSYRGTDPSHRDNVGLRLAMEERVPLVYFFGVDEGWYQVTLPVYVVGDDPRRLTFTVAADDVSRVNDAPAAGYPIADDSVDARRAYITAVVRRRLHQRSFRERVLRAYGERCALCRLRHHELLDAAHITPDVDEAGDPVVSNGLALCKLHHAAFDRFFLAVRPDYVVEVRESILSETDGPMLLVGLKGIHGHRIDLPRSVTQHPDRERLERRYELFRAAG